MYLRSITGQTSNGNLKGYMAPLNVAPDSTCVPPPITTTANPGGSTAAIGSSQHDDATVSDGTNVGSGSVKFFLCSPAEVTANSGDCKANGTQIGSTTTLNGSGKASSDSIDGTTTPNDNTPGKYCWRAEFTPDSNDHHFLSGSHTNSDTECFTIVKNQPALTTKLSADSILNTDPVTDTATLTGATSDASGAITISVYSGSDANACVVGNLVTSKTASPATSGNKDYSASFSGLAAGSYEFQASIAADAKNKSAVSACGTEPLTVMNQPALTTKLSADSILNTDPVTDTATLTGATSDASGAITISVYSGSDANACVVGNLVTSKTASPATSGNKDYSASFSGLAAGSYEFQASIAADAKNKSAVSACGTEPLTVMNQPALTTKLSADSILNTDPVTDTATLTGATSDASGAITISVYSGSDANACVVGNLVTSKTASPATSGNKDYSASFSGLAAGSYEFQASIAADAKNKSAVSACGTEPLTVMNQPALTTKLSADSILNTDPVTDTATLTGATSDASGAITISVYSGSDANACVVGNLVTSKTASPATSGNKDYSASFSGLAAGSYEFQASIAADAKNKSAVSACGTEPLTVQTQPSVSTVADPSSAVVGSDALKTASDTATFTDGFQLAGQDVSFTLFENPNCTGSTGIGGTVQIANDGQTATFTGDASGLSAGTYYWFVSYGGDTYNKPVTECGGDEGVQHETLTLGQHAPSVSTVADPSSAVVGSDALKTASDTATFTDGFQLAGQDVSFTLFENPNCTGSTGIGGTVQIANDGQTATFTGDASGLSAGTYYWFVSYGGDTNNNPVTECGGDEGVQHETLTIQPASPSITTTQDPASGSVGDTLRTRRRCLMG